jgi:hypothetical protein
MGYFYGVAIQQHGLFLFPFPLCDGRGELSAKQQVSEFAEIEGDFDLALRDVDGGGNSDPGFRYAPPWAIFVFSLRVCEFFVFLQNLLQKTNDLRAK